VPCIRPAAARLVIGRARLVGSPQKRSFHDPQRDSARAALAATRGLQSTRQASLVQVCIHLGLVFVFCCRGARRVKFSVPQLALPRMEWSIEDIFKFRTLLYTTRYSTSRTEPTLARPLVRHLPSCAASCSQIVFSEPICWLRKWCHVTRRAARRLVEPSCASADSHIHQMLSTFLKRISHYLCFYGPIIELLCDMPTSRPSVFRNINQVTTWWFLFIDVFLCLFCLYNNRFCVIYMLTI
jgi:hypothetical protein